MISEQAVREILSQYERFGWELRKILHTERFVISLDPDMFAGCEIISADIDAAWFSRAAQDGKIAWELRALDAFPFALIEVIDADTSQLELNAILKKVEQHLRDKLQNLPRTH